MRRRAALSPPAARHRAARTRHPPCPAAPAEAKRGRRPSRWLPAGGAQRSAHRPRLRGARPPARPGCRSPPRRSVRLYMPGCPRAGAAGPRRSFVIRSAPNAAGAGAPMPPRPRSAARAAQPAFPSRCAAARPATPLPAARSRGAVGRQGRAGAASRSSPRRRGGGGRRAELPDEPGGRSAASHSPRAAAGPGPERSYAKTRAAPSHSLAGARRPSRGYAAPHTRAPTPAPRTRARRAPLTAGSSGAPRASAGCAPGPAQQPAAALWNHA